MKRAILAAALLGPLAARAEEPAVGTAEDLVALSSAVASAKKVSRAIAARRETYVRPKVYLRFPTLEIAAVHSAGFLAGPAVRLSSVEVTAAQTVFGDAIDYEAVRVVSVPAAFGKAIMVWGDTIRVPPGLTLTRPNLIHELAHIWQYQTQGSGYISDSLLHQAASLSKTGGTEHAYDYAVTTGSKLADFNAEQQAEIAEDYYRRASLRADPNFQALIAQFRKAKPLPRYRDLWDEAAAGLPPRGQEPAPRAGSWSDPLSSPHATPWVPQLEIRFPGL